MHFPAKAHTRFNFHLTFPIHSICPWRVCHLAFSSYGFHRARSRVYSPAPAGGDSPTPTLSSLLPLHSPSILPATKELALSIQNALHTWKQLAENNVELTEIKARLQQLEELVEAARVEFDETLDDLNATDRDAIFSIMSVYEQQQLSEDELHWLVNKIGNEGVEGIGWSTLFAAWQQRYPQNSRVDLGVILQRHARYIASLEEDAQGVYRLTPEGQALFLNG